MEQLLKELQTAKRNRQNESATGLAQSATSDAFIDFDAFSLYQPPSESSNSSCGEQTFKCSGDLPANLDEEFSSSILTGSYVAQDGWESTEIFDW